MFDRMDAFMLERIFTPFAHWFERKTGRNNFYLAWLSFGVALVSFIVLKYLALRLDPDFVGWTMVSVVLVLPVYGFLLIVARNEQESGGDAGGVAASRKPTIFERHRFLFLVIAVLNTPVWIFELWQYLPVAHFLDAGFSLAGFISTYSFVAGLYFSGVPKPPPRRREEKEEAHRFETVPVPVGN